MGLNPKTILIKLVVEIAISLTAEFVVTKIKQRQLEKALNEAMGLDKSCFGGKDGGLF